MDSGVGVVHFHVRPTSLIRRVLSAGRRRASGTRRREGIETHLQWFAKTLVRSRVTRTRRSLSNHRRAESAVLWGRDRRRACPSR